MVGDRCLLDSFLRTMGEEFEIHHDVEARTVKGVLNSMNEGNVERKCIEVYPDTVVTEGDVIVRKITNERWVVDEVVPFVYKGRIDYLDIFYRDQKRREKPQAAAINYTFNNSSNIIAGNQANAAININIENIVNEIEEKGGEEKEELLALVSEIRMAFEQRESVNRGMLTRFSETLEKHSWITGSLVQIIGSTAIQFLLFSGK